MKLVKVRIKEGYHGHHHLGEERFPGDVLEVTPQRAAWLHKIGATEPVSTKKAAPEQEVASDPVSEPEDDNEPGGDEQEDPSTT